MLLFEIIKGRRFVCWLGVRYEDCSLYRCRTKSLSLSLCLSIFSSSQTGNVDLVWAQECPDNLKTQECLTKDTNWGLLLCLWNYHHILHHFHFFLTEFIYVGRVHCHGTITDLTAQLLGMKLASSSLTFQPPHYLPWSLHALGINSKFLWQFAIDSHIAALLLYNHSIIYITQPPKLQTLTLNWGSKMVQEET